MTNKIKPGEKAFSFIILIFSILALIESIRLFKSDPTSSSAGALPLFLSSIMLIFTLKIILLEDRKTGSENESIDRKEQFISAVQYIFPKDILVMFVFTLIYCLLLILGLGFVISTILFLIASMTYLMRGQIVKNVIYTAILMVFILIVFQTVFKVILP